MASILDFSHGTNGRGKQVFVLKVTQELYVGEKLDIAYTVSGTVTFDSATLPVGFSLAQGNQRMFGSETMETSPQTFGHLFRLLGTAELAIVAVIANVTWPAGTTDKREHDL